VRSGKYDALWLHGYAYAADLIALVAAKSHGIPVLMRSETHLGLSRPPLRQRIRDAVLSFSYRYIDAFLAIGTRNRAYYESLGVPASRIHLVPYTVDNERFIGVAGASGERAEVRSRLGVGGDDFVVLFASKLSLRKRAADLLRAVALVEARGKRATVLLVGSGELKSESESLARELNLSRAIFAGFVNQASLPAILRSVDAFVLPSESEPWGLIVNEAMCAGLPVVVTDQVGAASDLVKPGENGFVVPAGDVGALARAIETLAGDAAARRTMGQASLRIIRSWSYEECREGLLSALRSVHRA
jgi:glycosyltransferase involved in cell wall biosynthesis